MKILTIIFISLIGSALASEEKDREKLANEIVGVNRLEKFSLHRASYIIFGDDDLKLQLSFKYRLARELPLYFAYSQLMFWKVYDESKPFEDVNYSPELFYRFFDKSDRSWETLDIGYLHLSNGTAETTSRSLDRIFLRGNYFTKLFDLPINFNLMVHQIYNEDETNKDIVNNLGYWDMSILLMEIWDYQKGSLQLEGRVYAGSKIIDFDQGANQIGLNYVFKTQKFNPSIYFQRFEGYSENLLNYNKKRTEYRLGFNFTY